MDSKTKKVFGVFFILYCVFISTVKFCKAYEALSFHSFSLFISVCHAYVSLREVD